VTLRLYDSAARAVREFVPLHPGGASLYLCGATVQAPPHVGHIRSGVSFDMLRRWLTYRGYDVTYVRNVTDINDTILHAAGHEGVPFWVLAQRNERAFSWAYDTLGCLPPTMEPRATGHIPQMLSLVRRLLAAGHAYATGGDVYFDVRSWPGYGRLSGQRLEDMLAAPEGAGASKRDPHDFALWKGAETADATTWDTEWGPGRPGWHLECSAMATHYLGPSFDLHAGGLDLVFPHHENELAQSAAAGDPFARYWLHNAWVTTAGEKMSKSLGNSLLVSEVVTRARPVELRWYLAGAHYRSHMEFSDEALGDAAASYRRVEGFLARAAELVGAPEATGDACAEVPAAFAAAMDEDLAVPQALAVLHASVHEGNIALAAADKDAVTRLLAEVRAMLAVLGLDPHDPHWAGGGTDDQQLRAVVDALVALALDQRQAARARRDYAAADAVRDQLARAGISLEDTAAGPRWSLRRDAQRADARSGQR